MSIQLVDNFSRLPEEVRLQILSNLDAHALARNSTVSKAWNRLASDNSLWKRLFSGVDFPKDEYKVKEYIYSHAIQSRNELVQRVLEYIGRLQFYQKGTFIVYFPFQPDCTLHLQLGFVRDHRQEVNELWVYLKKMPNDRGSNSTSTGISYLSDFSITIPAHSGLSLLAITKPIEQNIGERIVQWENDAMTTGVMVVAAAALGMSLLNADTPD